MCHLCLEKQFKEQFIRKFYFVCTMKLFQSWSYASCVTNFSYFRYVNKRKGECQLIGYKRDSLMLISVNWLFITYFLFLISVKLNVVTRILKYKLRVK